LQKKTTKVDLCAKGRTEKRAGGTERWQKKKAKKKRKKKIKKKEKKPREK